ncbi:hypothetical protein D3C85_1549690 [compost metagenome]
MLFFTHCVGKAQVDKFYVVFGDELDYVCNRHGDLLNELAKCINLDGTNLCTGVKA